MAQIFCLRVAIAKRDPAMFRELWGQYTAWEAAHLVLVFRQLIEEQWTQGLQELLKSPTTEMLFSTQTLEKQE